MRAFIIRPFGTQNNINFDEVARLLISPALEAVGAMGRETLDIVESGNIRTDMFRRLLTADLVVADLSIHNANVFYELGIRHALRDHGTFMLRCDADRFPFDLQTDRYFVYSKDNPAASLGGLIKALRRTVEAEQRSATVKDSPVFTSLPNLKEPDPSLFNPVPQDFGEDVARAAARRLPGDLALFSYEVKGFEWEVPGWRAVGGAQFDLKALAGAKETWERVLRLEPNDLDANIRLGTIYERLGDLERSTEALRRVLKNQGATKNQRAEAYSLMARNAKTCWRSEWESKPPEERAAAALRSPHLVDSFENYARAFAEDLNHFYSGLNALAMLTVRNELAAALPEVWAEQFESDDEAARQLASDVEQARKLAAAVDLALTATEKRLEREGVADVWAEISRADLLFITSSKRPARVVAAYRAALKDAPDFAVDSVRSQLKFYKQLGVLTGNLTAVAEVVGGSLDAEEGKPAAAAPQRKRVLLFAGHMIDAPGREKPRFPADREQVARERIKEVIINETQRGAGVSGGYSGGASGGDILFQEICAELGIQRHLYLAITPGEYVKKSVKQAGQEWVDRFWSLHRELDGRNQVRVLSEAKEVQDDSEYLPAWLREKSGYNIWQRNNLWMLFNALDEACDPKSEDPNITLIALWDGEGGDGPGGTGDLVEKVENLGARSIVINTKELFGL